MTIASVFRNLAAMGIARRTPSRRAIAALAKVHGRKLQRRWPFLGHADRNALNLDFDDLLELQFARTRLPNILVVGAFDGLANDPLSRSLMEHPCRGIFVEPQPAAFERLRANFAGHEGLQFVNAAMDQQSGSRDFYVVDAASAELPDWTQQLASFSRQHIEKHEALAPGVSAHIRVMQVPTLSFDELLRRFGLDRIDVLQIDAEGMDAQLLRWFPFQRVRPALLHYEVAHMSDAERLEIRGRLMGLGYRIFAAGSEADDMAIWV